MRPFKILPKYQAFQWLLAFPLSSRFFYKREDTLELPEAGQSFTGRMLTGIFERPNQRC